MRSRLIRIGPRIYLDIMELYNYCLQCFRGEKSNATANNSQRHFVPGREGTLSNSMHHRRLNPALGLRPLRSAEHARQANRSSRNQRRNGRLGSSVTVLGVAMSWLAAYSAQRAAAASHSPSSTFSTTSLSSPFPKQ